MLKRQTGGIIFFESWLVWQWAKKETRQRQLGRIDHLLCDLIAEYYAKASNVEPHQINSAEQLYSICKDLAGKEGLSVAGFIEKVCTEEMERTSGLRLARTSEAVPVQDKGKLPWFALPKA